MLWSWRVLRSRLGVTLRLLLLVILRLVLLCLHHSWCMLDVLTLIR